MNYEAWLKLANAWVTARECGSLAMRFGSVEEITRQGASRLREAGLSDPKAAAIASPDNKLLRASLEWLEDENHHLVPYNDDACPELLTQISGRPLLLYVNGSIDVLHLPSLAIVGSRNPTRGGTQNAVEFARYLGRSGLSIVSGLAQGIDTAAHRGALEAGARTVAFLGHGIDRVYPASNHVLAHEIAERGALVSEFPLGTPPDKRHFPERNRLISGISLGVLVVEAARRSGTLITARLAAEQGREVFALPGSIHNPLARGCHTLIRQGAKLVESAPDILSELGALVGHLEQDLSVETGNTDLPESNDADYVKLRDTLSYDPATLDELGEQSGLTIEQLSSMLLILELHGEVEAMSGGRYALAG